MAIPNDRKSLLAAIETSFTRLMDVIEAIPPDRIDEATLEGHSVGATSARPGLPQIEPEKVSQASMRPVL